MMRRRQPLSARLIALATLACPAIGVCGIFYALILAAYWVRF